MNEQNNPFFPDTFPETEPSLSVLSELGLETSDIYGAERVPSPRPEPAGEPVFPVAPEPVPEAPLQPEEDPIPAAAEPAPQTVLQPAEPERAAEPDIVYEEDDPENSLPEDPPAPKRHRKPAPPVEPENDRYAMPGWLKAMVYIVAVITASFLISVAVWFCAEDVFGFGKPDEEIVVTIKNTDTLNDVIDNLSENDVIRYKWLFKLFCSVAKAQNKISAGTYTLNRVYDYNAIINSMTASSAARAVVNVTVPEGYSCARIFRLLEENGVCTAAELEKAAASVKFDYAFLSGIPYGSANRLEGYLFPDTYQFYVGDDPERVLKKFLSNFEVKLTDELLEDLDDLNKMLAKKMRANGFTEAEIEASQIDLRSLTIVASIVQRESYSVSESSSIAAVIYNRLSGKTYPLLEIDSTLRYALNKWDEPLTDADYRTDSGYNTSRNPGLPEGPISNPGMDSFRAALYPRDCGYQFYCYNASTGLHYFAETYYDYQDFLGGKSK